MSLELPFISVIIPVYNDPEGLKLTLEALENQSYPRERFEILVVDNGSSNDIHDICLRYSDVCYHFEGEPGSYRARNVGYRASVGTVLAFTDADCVPHSQWLSRAVRHLTEEPECDAVGGRIEVFAQDRETPGTVEWYEIVAAFPQHHFIERWNFSATANLIVRRAVFESVGPFNPSLKSGGDVDWGQRATHLGHRLRFAPDVVVAHPARRTLRELLAKARRIQGGLHDIRAFRGDLPLIPYLCSSLVSWPSLRLCWRLLGESGVRSKLTKLQVCGILLLFRTVRFSVSLWLLTGASTHRS